MPLINYKLQQQQNSRMSRIERIKVSNFLKGKNDISDVMKDSRDIELYAEGPTIETAISLAEYFVDKEKTAYYQSLRSELITTEKGVKVPAVRIQLTKVQNQSQNQLQKPHKYARYVPKPAQPTRQTNEQPKRPQPKQHNNDTSKSRQPSYSQKRRNGPKDRYE